MKTIQIANRIIGDGQPPLIIAEMSGNHNQSLERALAIVDAAAKAGAHAMKLQTYTADTLTIDAGTPDFFINDANSLWQGETLYSLYQKAYTPWEWHKPIFERCKKLNLICFSTAFDESAVDFLEDLDVPAYKIASFENNHLALIRKIAETHKPIIISTGMASLADLESAVETVRSAGNENIVLLKCTSSYPASPMDTNIATIPHLRGLFNVQVGLSDHTLGMGVAIASIALGAVVVEKHFTLSRSDGGVDAAFSMEPEEMETFATESRRAWQAIGKISYGRTERETASMKFRRSIYVVQDMHSGDVFSPQNIRVIRPGNGLPPSQYQNVLGKKVVTNTKKGTALTWNLVS